MPSRAPRLYRRAILIYIATIVAPIGVLLWLGVQSFDRQRQALAALSADRLAAEVDARTRAAAGLAIADPTHPLVHFPFVFERGILLQPALHAALPRQAPPAFIEAERLELTQPELALQAYRRLSQTPASAALALSRMARCLGTLGREAEARALWRTLAQRHPDDRDLSHRPYGIVGAINAGETAGLYDRISAGLWDLSADQAEYFLGQLDPAGQSPYLDRFRIARQLSEDFRPPTGLRTQDIRTQALGPHMIFYRSAGADRVEGFVANRPWMDALRVQLQTELGLVLASTRDLRMYAGAIAVVLVVLSAGVVLLVRDTTREARTNALRAEFVSGVSHELKTPITLVRLYGETLLRHDTLQEGERREFYRIITRESARLGRLVDQVLTFSRVERGDDRYDLKEGDLGAAVAGVLDDYRDWLEQGGFSLARVLPERLPMVRFDPEAVSQAVVNLLDNAVKYSGTSREIAVRVAAENGHVTVEVEDRGVGIPATEQSKVFDRFYRVGNASGKGGYGLGLFMVRHIMAVHRGRAEVDSEPGRGSRFRLVFPVAVS